MELRERPGFALRPVVETWDATVLEVTGSRTAYLVVPRAAEGDLERALDRGELDELVTTYLSLPDRGKVLAGHADTRRLGLFDRLGDPAALAAPERDPATGIRMPAPSREDKGREQQQSSPPEAARPALVRPPSRLPLLAGVGAGAVALLLAAGAVYAATRPDGAPTSEPTQSTPVAAPTAGPTAEPIVPEPSEPPEPPEGGQVAGSPGSLALYRATVELLEYTTEVDFSQAAQVGDTSTMGIQVFCGDDGLCSVSTSSGDDAFASRVDLLAVPIEPGGRLFHEETELSPQCTDGTTFTRTVDLVLDDTSITGTIANTPSSLVCDDDVGDATTYFVRERYGITGEAVSVQ